MKRSPMTRAMMLVLTLVLVCTSVLVAPPQTAEAAAKPKEITLSAKKRTLYVGKSFTLKVKSVKPANASKAVTFKSSNTKVATVNSKGKITAKKKGTSTITVTSKSNSKVKATCKVTVKQQVTDIVVTNAIRKKVVVPKGKTLTLKTTVLPSNAANKGVEYVVRNPKIVTVSANGKIKANKYGTTRVAIQSKDKQKKIVITVYVPKVRVKSVSLNASKKSLDVGKTFRLKTTIKPAKGTVKVVSYKSSNPDIAYVSVGGNVRGVRPGKAVVTVTTLDGKKKAKCTFTVNPIKVKKIQVVPDSQNIIVGQKFTVSAKVTPSNATNKDVTWASSNTDIVRVSSKGVVTAVGVGEATITATAKDGSKKTGSCKVTVLPEPEDNNDVLIKSIKVFPPSIPGETLETFKVGDVTYLRTEITLENGVVITTSEDGNVKITSADGTDITETDKDKYQYSLTWISNHPEVAIVDPVTGKLTAMRPGNTDVSALAMDGSEERGTCVVTVEPADPAGKPIVEIKETAIDLGVGAEKELTWNVDPTGTQVTWASADNKIATVANGVVTAVAPGQTKVTATAKDGNVAECIVNVYSLTLEDTELTLAEGVSQQIAYNAEPRGTAVTWSSSDEAKATVDQTGKVTAVAEGTAKITAQIKNANGDVICTASCDVTVVKVGITLDKEAITLKANQVAGEQLTATVTPEGIAGVEVEWVSEDTTVAEVSSNGLVTPATIPENTVVDVERTATVKAIAKIGGKEIPAECAVTVITEKNAQSADDDNFVFGLEKDVTGYKATYSGQPDVYVTKDQADADMATFRSYLSKVVWDNNLLNNYWASFDEEKLRESVILDDLLLPGDLDVVDINATTKEITVKGRTTIVERVAGQNAGSLKITDKSSGSTAYIRDINVQDNGANVVITAQAGRSATSGGASLVVTIAKDGTSASLARVSNGNSSPIITYTETEDSYMVVIDRRNYNDLVEQAGERFDFLNPEKGFSITNLYYNID